MEHEYSESEVLALPYPTSYNVAGVSPYDYYSLLEYSFFEMGLLTSTVGLNTRDYEEPIQINYATEIFTGFQAITTYPPIYKQFDTSSTSFTLVVPRVYPPIYVKPTGRNRR